MFNIPNQHEGHPSVSSKQVEIRILQKPLIIDG